MIGHGNKKGMTCAKLDALRDTTKVVTDYDGCDYITAGKEYELIGNAIVDDEGDTIACYPYMTLVSHLDHIGTWRHPLRT